jgi:hypothetical protein
MDALNFPRHIAPVAQGDRIKRAKPRKDAREGFNFAKHLRKPAKPPPPSGETDDAPDHEASEPSPGAREPENAAEGEARAGASFPPPGPKLVDIRV